MSTDAAPTFTYTYEDAVKNVEKWANIGKASEDEQLEFLLQAIKDLGQPGNQEVFKAAMVELGVRAVQTDEAFHRVKSTLDEFMRNNGADFPGLLHFQTQWNGYVTTWRETINTSRAFATQTSASYDLYTVMLRLTANITTREDMLLLAADLKEFGNKNPVGIPVDFENQFTDLRRAVENFRQPFIDYLDSQDARLTQEAETLRLAIDDLKIAVEGLNKQVEQATIALAIAAWWGPVAAAAAGTALGILSKKRSDKQKELDGKIADLKRVEAQQAALSKIRLQFEALAPDFEILATNLNLFASTWNAFHHQANEFATFFEAVLDPPNFPPVWQGNIDLAIAVSVPLSQGLKDYASSIN